jgi:ubiquinone/menaquinone biosynthesis C-methylase UbiE
MLVGLRCLVTAACVLVAACGRQSSPPEDSASATASPQPPAPASSPPPAPSAPHADGPQHEHHSTARHDPPDKFADPEQWSKVFDDPKRDAWQKPDQVVRELALRPDHVVADLGAGTGYFTIRIAKAVPKGKVYGIDLSQGMLDWIDKRAARDGLKNVATILAAADDPKLPKGIDLLLVVDTFHHITDRVQYFKRVRERLKPGARVVIIDYKEGKLPVGPPDGHKIPRHAIEREMTKAGYALCRSWDGLEYQHALFFAERC